jgi:hypothetical protein
VVRGLLYLPRFSVEEADGQVNMHELAVVSGMSVACRLGAKYPFPKQEEEFGFSFFKSYMLLNHGKRYK